MSAPTASQNVSCRQCLRELAKNTKHHCRTTCQSNATPMQNKWLVYKLLYGMCHSQSNRNQWSLCTCSNSRDQAVLPIPHNNSVGMRLVVNVSMVVGVHVIRTDGVRTRLLWFRVTVDMSHVCIGNDCHLSLLRRQVLRKVPVTSPSSP